MSKDIQIGFPCPHYIVEEVGRLDTDSRTVIVGSPIVSLNSTVVLLNNELYIPQEGLYNQAFLTSSKTGPYVVEVCKGLLGPDNNVLIVEVPGKTITVRLPISRNLSLLDLQKALRQTDLYDYVEITQYNNAIALQEKSYLGNESYIRVSGKGAEVLGFVQKGARGKMLIPGWDLVKDDTVIPFQSNPRQVSTRKLRFKQPLLGDPSIKLSYTTQSSVCRRCKGTYVENDYRFDSLGDVLIVENENLLIQACIKVVLTERKSNPFHPGYGSDVMTRIGRKIVGDVVVDLKQDIVTALRKMQQIQNKQRQYQTVSTKESLYSIMGVEVLPDEFDPTKYYIDVSLRNASNEPVSISIVYTAPGAIALAGSNGMSLGTETLGDR